MENTEMNGPFTRNPRLVEGAVPWSDLTSEELSGVENRAKRGLLYIPEKDVADYNKTLLKSTTIENTLKHKIDKDCLHSKRNVCSSLDATNESVHIQKELHAVNCKSIPQSPEFVIPMPNEYSKPLEQIVPMAINLK